jgi:hypothetical protein
MIGCGEEATYILESSGIADCLLVYKVFDQTSIGENNDALKTRP